MQWKPWREENCCFSHISQHVSSRQGIVCNRPSVAHLEAFRGQVRHIWAQQAYSSQIAAQIDFGAKCATLGLFWLFWAAIWLFLAQIWPFWTVFGLDLTVFGSDGLTIAHRSFSCLGASFLVFGATFMILATEIWVPKMDQLWARFGSIFGPDFGPFFGPFLGQILGHFWGSKWA